MSLYLTIILGCILAAVALLQGVTLWWKKDVVRGIAMTAMSFFIVLFISVISVVNAVDGILEEKIQKHGIENTIGGINDWKHGPKG